MWTRKCNGAVKPEQGQRGTGRPWPGVCFSSQPQTRTKSKPKPKSKNLGEGFYSRNPRLAIIYTAFPILLFTRRQFNVRAAAITLAAPFLKFAGSGSSDRANDSLPELSAGDYTPFGYLDNPFHSWALNRSGI